jgi:hypothetical protein
MMRNGGRLDDSVVEARQRVALAADVAARRRCARSGDRSTSHTVTDEATNALTLAGEAELLASQLARQGASGACAGRCVNRAKAYSARPARQKELKSESSHESANQAVRQRQLAASAPAATFESQQPWSGRSRRSCRALSGVVVLVSVGRDA